MEEGKDDRRRRRAARGADRGERGERVGEREREREPEQRGGGLARRSRGHPRSDEEVAGEEVDRRAFDARHGEVPPAVAEASAGVVRGDSEREADPGEAGDPGEGGHGEGGDGYLAVPSIPACAVP